MQSTNHHYALILAGGSGTRLWPLSRKDLPKQMQNFISDKPLIAETVDRIREIIPTENIFIGTGLRFKDKIQEQLPDIPAENIIAEPIARGTTAAYALATRIIQTKDPEAIIFSMASDHAVQDLEVFQQTVKDAFEFVTNNPNYISIVGIKPHEPNTSLGYIKLEAQIQDNPVVYSVEKFVEKPSRKVAEYYLSTNQYYWNSAYYCYRADTLLKAYHETDPAILDNIDKFIASGLESNFLQVPEKAHEIEFINTKKYPLALIPGHFRWSDIGNWQSLHKLLTELTDTTNISNTPHDNHIDVGSSDYLVIATDDRLITTANLNNIAIISTPDSLLVLNKDNPSYVKNIIEFIKEKGLEEYL